MIKKLNLILVFSFLFITNLYSKAPPLGTGSLVPANIMIMLDNSGSMAWDLGGNQLTNSSLLSNPTDINVDSQGNIYVIGSFESYESNLYRMHVFNPDGSIKKRLIKHDNDGRAYFNPRCGMAYTTNPKFDIHDDKIYYLSSGYRTALNIIDLNGNCIRMVELEHEVDGGRPRWETIEVTDNYIYLGTGNCSYFCYKSTVNRRNGQKAAGAIMILRRSDLSWVRTIGGQGSYYQHNLWGNQGDIAISPDGTKFAVASVGASSVCIHDVTEGGANISNSCTKV